MKQETVGAIEIVIAAVLFAFIPILVRFGAGLGAYNLSFFRFLIAALAILAVSLLSRGFSIAPLGASKGKLLLFGALHGFNVITYFVAIRYLSISSAVLLLYSAAIWVVVFAYFILDEKITRRTLLALAVALAGVVLVLSPKTLFVRESLVGSLSGILSGVGFGLIYVLSKTFKTYDKQSLTLWQNLLALPFVFPLVLLHPPSFAPVDVGILLLLGVGCTAAPYILAFRGFEKLPAQRGAVINLLGAVFPILLAFAIFHEIPPVGTIIGGILIVAGFYLVITAEADDVRAIEA